MAIHRNQDGVLVSWLMKLLAFTAVAAFVLLNAGAIVTNMFSLSDKADQIAVSVSTSMANDQGMTTYQAQTMAEKMASDSGARLIRLWVDGQNVLHVRLKRSAHVALIGDVHAFKKFVVAKQTGTSAVG
jgi:hypothetical protein